MKILKKIPIIFAIFAILFVLATIVTPADFTVVRQIDINAPAERIVTSVRQLSNWDKWSHWSWNLDPTLVITHKIDSISGKVIRIASGEQLGSLEIRPMASKSPEFLNFEMDLNEGHPLMEIEIGFYTTPKGVRIVWTQKGRVRRNFSEKVSRWTLDKKLGRHIENSLTGLKKFSEQ